jgi:hypothetical protein
LSGGRFSLTTGASEGFVDGGKCRTGSSGHKAAVSVSTWKQLREKLHALQIELHKWLTIRDKLGSLIDNIVRGINNVQGTGTDEQLYE